MNIILKNIKQLIGITENSDTIKKGKAQGEVKTLENAYLIVRNNIIESFGPMSECPELSIDSHDCAGRLVLPMYVDSHTHLIFAESRSGEMKMRLHGKSYQEIAETGGGILNSAAKLHAMSEQQLYEEAQDRMGNVIKQGTGAIEIKSGYGLNIEDEMKMLRVIRVLKSLSPIPIKATFLGAHALPTAFKNNKDAYMYLVTKEMLPRIAGEGLADYIDIFCETGYFSLDDLKQVIEAGDKHGLKAKVHVNQFSSFGAVKMACEMGALSVDHLEIMNEDDYSALASSNTIATGLPLCSLFLDIPYTPGRQLIDKNIPLAVASDFNPGSSPSSNLNLAFGLACSQMKLTPEEAFNALTYNAAFAMEVQNEVGSIQVGKKANLIVTKPANGLEDIPYWFGDSMIGSVVV
ncbi:imidazolonepropionase [Bacteroidia bacterium]|jgi:imidazolonepropionase|nr:imidazolonepropionase [Bacteroidia bacterium]MDC0105231.1 imidazolonepropionase [Bacteroidia bacterium]